MTQPDLFDAVESERLKEEGIERAADSKQDLLTFARDVAWAICRRDGTVHADKVARYLEDEGHPQLGPAAGALFKEKRETWAWEWTGEWHASERIKNHGRLQRIWKFK